MFKKFILAGVLVLSFVITPFVPIVSADTASDLQAQLSAIMAQIQRLQAQLNTSQGTPATSGGSTGDYSGTTSVSSSDGFCHKWNKSLKLDDYGADVQALHKALFSEGFQPLESSSVTGDGRETYNFTESTASAVIDFQAKYGIKKTGTVGPMTRAKLNSLYPCGKNQANYPLSISVYSSNGSLDSTIKISVFTPSGAPVVLNPQRFPDLPILSGYKVLISQTEGSRVENLSAMADVSASGYHFYNLISNGVTANAEVFLTRNGNEVKAVVNEGANRSEFSFDVTKKSGTTILLTSNSGSFYFPLNQEEYILSAKENNNADTEKIYVSVGSNGFKVREKENQVSNPSSSSLQGVVITDVKYSPSSPKVNEWITTDVVLLNKSTVDINTPFRVVVQGTAVVVSGLAAGAQKTVSVPNAFTFNFSGSQILNTVLIDQNGNSSVVYTNTLTFQSTIPTQNDSITTTPFTISSVSGNQSNYAPGSTINLTIKGIDGKGNIASSDKGFNIQAYIFPVNDTNFSGNYVVPYPRDSFNGTYNSSTGYWNVSMNVPAAGSYNLKLGLYCSRVGSSCYGLNGPGDQGSKVIPFTVSSVNNTTTFSLFPSDTRALQIISLYRTILNREPDNSGFYYFYNGGTSIDQIKSAMLESVEYQNVSHSTSTCISGFVQDSSGVCTATRPELTLKVLSPNGGENFAFNGSVPIRWQYSGISSSAYVHVYLKLADGSGCFLSSVPASYLQTTLSIVSRYQCPNIPASVNDSGSYKVSLILSESSSYSQAVLDSIAGRAVGKDSNYFTLSNPTVATVPAPTVDVTVVSPNGGESWQSGTVQSIRWKKIGGEGTSVIVAPVNSSCVYSTLCPGADISIVGLPSDSVYPDSYSWNVGSVVNGNGQTTLSPGNYKIRIGDLKIGIFDWSDSYFTITAPTTATVPAPTVNVTVDGSKGPLSIQSGQWATGSWNSTNASYCTNNFNAPDRVTSNRATTYGPITSTKHFTVTCFNSAGASVSGDVTVNVAQATAVVANQSPVIRTWNGLSTIQAGVSGIWSLTASDPDGTILTAKVNWGDGTAEETRTITTSSANSIMSADFAHSYVSGNYNYTTRITVTDARGAINSKDLLIPVTVKPVAAVTTTTTIPSATTNKLPIFRGFPTGPATLTTGQSGSWSTNSYDPDGSSILYSVSWGDGTSAGGSVGYSYYGGDLPGNFSHTYSTAGNYALSFTASDTQGGSVVQTTTVVVSAPAVANQQVNLPASQTTAPLSVSCSAAPSSPYVGDVVTWGVNPSGGTGSYTFSWTGSDGLSGGNSPVATITYTTAGYKTASVSVTSGFSSVSWPCNVTVQNRPVQVSPTINYFRANGSASFISVTAGTPVALTWSSSNTTSCTALSDWNNSIGVSGSLTLTPSVSSSYGLVCHNVVGEKISANLYVTVTPAQIATPVASSVSINVTGPLNSFFAPYNASITWTSSGATQVKIEACWSSMSQCSTITSSTNASSGSYYWAIDSADAYVGKGLMKIRITDISSGVSSVSPSEFQVIKSSTSLKQDKATQMASVLESVRVALEGIKASLK
ncbi:MAG: hypothetical protein EXS46_01610 [Candidatus Taylorbacteria bacterium]|nr:hypothetical protein [Candidatus Taylorbacteria bacterium]